MKKTILFAALFLCVPCFASEFKAIYAFQGGTDGYTSTGLVVGKDGYLYGATLLGGTDNCGTIFRMSRTGAKTILYNFTGGSDGCVPVNALTMDQHGNFYGTTDGGGNGYGTIFRITPKGEIAPLYAFQGPPNDVENPSGPLAIDAQGNLYGVGYGGSNSCDFGDEGCGGVFELSTGGVETILYNFTGSPDGMFPYGPIVVSSGVLYGTTEAGGDSSCYQGPPAGCGVAYSFTLNTKTESVLHTFEQSGGAFPEGLIADSKGNFYGDTGSGGTYGENAGVLFKLVPGQQGWTENVLYDFGGPRDGTTPAPGLVLDELGDVYGTTHYSNRSNGVGSAFKVSPSGAETVLHNFVVTKGSNRAPGGRNPGSGLVSYDNGALYGAAGGGGDYQVCREGCGVVFRVER